MDINIDIYQVETMFKEMQSVLSILRIAEFLVGVLTLREVGVYNIQNIEI